MRCGADGIVRARSVLLFRRGVESRLATLYEKLVPGVASGDGTEAYDRLAYNQRTRAFFEALRRGLLNREELDAAARELQVWIDADCARYHDELRTSDST